LLHHPLLRSHSGAEGQTGNLYNKTISEAFPDMQITKIGRSTNTSSETKSIVDVLNRMKYHKL